MEKDYTKDILSIISKEIENYPKELSQDGKINKRKKLDDQVNRAGGVKQLAKNINKTFSGDKTKVLRAGGDVQKSSVLLMFYKLVSQTQGQQQNNNLMEEAEQDSYVPFDFTKEKKFDDLFRLFFQSVDENNKIAAQQSGKSEPKFKFMTYVQNGEKMSQEENGEDADEPEQIDANKVSDTIKNQKLNEFGFVASLLLGTALGVVGSIGTQIAKNSPTAVNWAKGIASDHPIMAKIGKFLTGFDVEEVAKGPDTTSAEDQTKIASEAIAKLYSEVGLSFTGTIGQSSSSADQTSAANSSNATQTSTDGNSYTYSTTE